MQEIHAVIVRPIRPIAMRRREPRRARHSSPVKVGERVELPNGVSMTKKRFFALKTYACQRLLGGKILDLAVMLRDALPKTEMQALASWMLPHANGRDLKDRLKSHYLAVLIVARAEDTDCAPDTVLHTIIANGSAKGLIL